MIRRNLRNLVDRLLTECLQSMVAHGRLTDSPVADGCAVREMLSDQLLLWTIKSSSNDNSSGCDDEACFDDIFNQSKIDVFSSFTSYTVDDHDGCLL